MLFIDPSIIFKINASNSVSDLFEFLQNAIKLEHSTIPPYLTAELSIKSGTNSEVRNVIHSVVIQEMLHFTIACNVLNALGGSPVIYQKDFVPNYPTPLPMGIHDGLCVGLEKYSKELVEKIFLEIEEPENPLTFPTALAATTETGEPAFATIGQFYKAIQQKIVELTNDNLPGNPALQVVSDFFNKDVLFPIKTKEHAINAIEIIIEQGEGTDQVPIVEKS